MEHFHCEHKCILSCAIHSPPSSNSRRHLFALYCTSSVPSRGLLLSRTNLVVPTLFLGTSSYAYSLRDYIRASKGLSKLSKSACFSAPHPFPHLPHLLKTIHCAVSSSSLYRKFIDIMPDATVAGVANRETKQSELSVPKQGSWIDSEE